ncbi:MAG: type II toxin-antitoxin system death-on-curing family toxin [Planctomycetales bacterium]|nr:type II toxin-antitoxin system death-on-curing family toxin [Planctomycetales bacterium]
MHRLVIELTGGGAGVRDLAGVESAVVQPQMTFGAEELYPTLIDKAAALCFSLVLNHPFVDGNKRIGHAAMETFLILNGHQLDADVDDAEQLFLKLAAGEVQRSELIDWITANLIEMDT